MNADAVQLRSNMIIQDQAAKQKEHQTLKDLPPAADSLTARGRYPEVD